MVRNDFEKLSTLMVDTPDAEATLGNEYRIDRIVLFIDDLDSLLVRPRRKGTASCPPSPCIQVVCCSRRRRRAVDVGP